MNNLKFSVEQQTAEIDGVQYKLTKVEPEKPKLPTWEELATRLSHEQMCIVGFPNRYYNKALTFIRLLEVADYLNEGWVPDESVVGYVMIYDTYLNRVTVIRDKPTCVSQIHFRTKKLAETAIDIFLANGAEQDLIDFFTT